MAVVFDSVGFSAELDSLKSKVSDKLKSELKTAMTEESKSQLDGKNPNDAQAYTNFYNSVSTVGTFKKNIIPEDVYKAIMLEAAVRDKTISKGFDIGNLDGKTVSSISSWFQGIFGKKTMTVGKYKVTMQSNYSAQVTSPSGRVYSLTWTLDNTAKKALKAYIADLKTYLSDYRYQIYGEIIKDGLSPLINEFIAEVAEGVDSAREKLINSFHEWALNKAADVAIDKILPKTYKQIKAVDKNYKEFVSKFNTLKTYVKTVKDDSITSNKKYTAFVKAYNNLGIGNYVDVVANYLSYEFLETESGIFGQNKALITGTDSDNKISASGSYVTIKGGGGNDFISASGSKSRISGDAGNDKVLLEGSQGSISGGAGSDSIVVDGERNTVLGGANDDYIALFKGKNTITGGKGNDTIFFVGVGESVIKYNKGDGSDTIIGYDVTDTIKITGNYSTQTSGQDVIITVDNGSIRLVGASGKQININNTNKVIGKFTYDEATTYTLPSFYGGTNYVKYGTNGDDTNWGGYYYSSNYTGNVFINMLAGNDTIHNGGDNVTIDGGADNDSISNNGDHVTINGGSGNDSISSSTKTVWNSQSRKYETVTGSNVAMNGGDGDDTISNSYKKTTYGQSYGGNNFIADGGNGNDSITNYGNNATLFSGNGDDTILNGGDSVTIESGAGNDNILNSGNDISINSGAGNDYIDSWSNGDSVTIDSGTGNDTISSSSDNSLIQSGAGNDSIFNHSDNSTIDAGAGNDFVRNIDKSSHSSKVSISGGTGNDSIYNDYIYYNGYSYDGGSDVTINGGEGNDLITINKYDSWNNLIEYKSGEGNDTIIGFNETSTLSIAGGGYVTTSGEDVIIKSGSGSVLLSDVRLNETLNIVFSDGSDTSGALFVKGSAKSDNIGNRISNSTINALDGDDNIWNGASTGSKNATNVSIIGGNGNDSITNTYGDFSTIDGGAENDTLHNDRADNVIVNGGAGNDSIYNYDNHNSSLYGGTGDDTLTVHYGEKVFMDGGTGNDFISNGDRYFRGSKNSTILGGKGNDTILNHYDTNIVFKYLNGDGNDIISGFNSMSTLSIGGGSYSTTKSGDDVIVTVGDGKISLIGAARYNVNIIHQVSTKTLTNKNSANITIGADIDVADASTRTKAIKIVGNAFDNTILGGSKSDSLYGGKGADSLIGNAGNDKIYGQAGNDILKGGAGNDSLWGGAGNDSLWGDAGNDTFIYASGEGKDVIYGFENNDLLKITGAFSASYSKSKGEIYFKVGSTSKAITLTDFSATSFNVNGTNYKISGTKLVKK